MNSKNPECRSLCTVYMFFKGIQQSAVTAMTNHNLSRITFLLVCFLIHEETTVVTYLYILTCLKCVRLKLTTDVHCARWRGRCINWHDICIDKINFLFPFLSYNKFTNFLFSQLHRASWYHQSPLFTNWCTIELL